MSSGIDTNRELAGCLLTWSILACSWEQLQVAPKVKVKKLLRVSWNRKAISNVVKVIYILVQMINLSNRGSKKL